jgi:hypothetical protein
MIHSFKRNSIIVTYSRKQQKKYFVYLKRCFEDGASVISTKIISNVMLKIKDEPNSFFKSLVNIILSGRFKSIKIFNRLK